MHALKIGLVSLVSFMTATPVEVAQPSPPQTQGSMRALDGEATAANCAQFGYRIGQTDDIARVAGFLAGPDSGWVTGQVIDASGGSRL